MKFSMFRIPLKIHIWGGFGSQLYGINVAMKMQDIFPKRRISLVFHSSGVTRRKLELPNFIARHFIFSEVDDFTTSAPTSKKSKGNVSRIIIRKLAIYFGFLAELSSEKSTLNLQPWLFQLRGHYSYLRIHPAMVEILAESLQLNIHRPSNLSCCLHFRLGDLLYLTNKTFIDPKRVIQELNIRFRNNEITLLSDSSESELREVLGIASSPFHFSFNNMSPLDTVSFGALSKIFIGTNSKLSLWISILRYQLNIGQSTSLPRELFSVLKLNCPDIENSNNFHEY